MSQKPGKPDGRNTGMSAKALRVLGETFFTKKEPLLSLQQEIAENFYVERADFTVKRYLSDDYAGNLMTSYPLLCRRDLTDQIGTMLRNSNKTWFRSIAKDPDRNDYDAKAWLEWATGTQRRIMYAPATLFTKACSQGDADYASFGQCAITVRMNRMGNDLIYRCWHLRDLAWMEDEDGKICAIWRRWKPSNRTIMRLFDGRPGCTVHPSVTRAMITAPEEERQCMHIMVAADMYDGENKQDMAWRSIYYDCSNEHEMESVAQRNREYVIPRWLTVSGSQYAHSPATVAALPEGRLLQSMTYTLLEAGEKVVNPPMVATEQIIRSDVAIMAGGITWVDPEYDQRSGPALQALTQDSRGMPLSKEMQMDSRSLIAQAFYLNRLTLPQRAPEMTAYEVGQRIQEYIRNALPLFEPMEAEYNGALCEETFNVILQHGGFGSPMDMPKSLRGAEVDFRFESPLHDAIEEQKGQKFLEAGKMLAEAAALDKGSYAVLDAKKALRDALEGIGTPIRWMRSEAEVEQMANAEAAKQQTAELLAAMGQGAVAAKDLASAQSMAAPAPATI